MNDTVKVTLDMPKIEGYEYTGEHRKPLSKEPFTYEGGDIYSTIDPTSDKVFILKKVRKRAEHGDKYLTITTARGIPEIIESWEADSWLDEMLYAEGNYYLPGERHLAEQVLDKIQKVCAEALER